VGCDPAAGDKVRSCQPELVSILCPPEV
jgi:hypothetical protein